MSKQAYAIPVGTPAERILKVASDLFFKQGYRATGINEVIAKSGVAKATFYSHFKSKDELCCEYLKTSSKNAMRHINGYIDRARGPLNKFLAPIRSMEPLMLESNFRGCAFMNIASEMPDCSSPLREEGARLYDWIGARLLELTTDLIESDLDKYGLLNGREVAEGYHLVMAGAVALAELYASVEPVQEGEKSVKRLIEASNG